MNYKVLQTCVDVTPPFGGPLEKAENAESSVVKSHNYPTYPGEQLNCNARFLEMFEMQIFFGWGLVDIKIQFSMLRCKPICLCGRPVTLSAQRAIRRWLWDMKGGERH